MFNRYYQQELSYLRGLAVQFSKAHPALAPMLSGPSTDPDVERLLEGVAFLTGLLKQKLDDEYPEIVHELIQLIWPHYLRPIPSSTIVAFTPKPILKQSLVIPAGIHLASVPVDGTSCLFKTCYDVEVHPLTLVEAALKQEPGHPPTVMLKFHLNGLKLSDWQPSSLRLFLGADYPSACDLYCLLRSRLKQISIVSQGSSTPLVLTPDFLKPVGLSEREALIPYPSHSFPGYRILQEYFVFPEKFLFLDLEGWELWHDRGEGSQFTIAFELGALPWAPPRITRESFFLFATPVINLFPHEADPIRLDHRKTEYLVRPSGSIPGHHQTYSIEEVIGFVHGTAQERRYQPFDFFKPEVGSSPVYHINHKRSLLGEGFDVYLSVAYPPESGVPATETLSLSLLCTNGFLPEQLKAEDISQHTSSSPEYVEFRNIHSPKAYVLPPVGTNLLWQFLSHLSLNYLSLNRAENLRALLQLYLFPNSRDRSAFTANQKRLAAIEAVKSIGSDRLVSGILMRGQEIKLKVREDYFASPGDLFLFGCVLDGFLGGYATINTFTHLFIEEVTRGEQYQWPARIGDHPLI
jgi:type VI secretion system protein ImpG